MANTVQTSQRTTFLNVDLDLYSKMKLEPLASALGDDVFPLFMGRERSLWSAHLELSEQARTADEAIRRFCALIRALPPAARKLWHTAKTRDFNIGLQAGSVAEAREFKLSLPTIRCASSLNARIVITVYSFTFSPQARH